MAARCVVVGGAGIVGSCISLRLAQQGADLTVVEAYRPGYGATANSFAWVGASHPGLHEPEPYFLLNALGVQAYRRLEAEFDLAPWFARSGCLTWSTDHGGQEATVKNVDYLTGRGYNAALVGRSRAAQLEPAAALPEACEAAAFFPDEGWVHGPPFAGRILSHARAAGAQVVMGESAVGFAVAGGRVSGCGSRQALSLPLTLSWSPAAAAARNCSPRSRTSCRWCPPRPSPRTRSAC